MPDDGILLIDKPAGMTSFGVVARIRRVLSQAAGRKIKVGHTGTLDPFATGLMILVVGAECRNAQIYTKQDKTYQATIVLGQSSTTGDPEGEIATISTTPLPREMVEEVINQFRGDIMQTPPVYSAVKINGQRAYDLARKGKVVEMPSRTVTIYMLDIIDYAWPLLTIRTHVSSGTYIRSLAVDIGRALGTEAYCRELRRVRIGDKTVEDAQTLADFGIMT